MEIIEIKDYKQNKVKVILDNEIAFVMYKGDLSKYGLSIGPVDDNTLRDIYDNCLYRRALDRALKIITGRDMLTKQLFDKLSMDLYPEEICFKVVERLKEERLLDDERFIKLYIESKSEKKSKNDVLRDLSGKGADMNLVEEIYNILYDSGDLTEEKDLIERILVKKKFDPDNSDFDACQKMIRYLLNKGFKFESIRSAMEEFKYNS